MSVPSFIPCAVGTFIASPAPPVRTRTPPTAEDREKVLDRLAKWTRLAKRFAALMPDDEIRERFIRDAETRLATNIRPKPFVPTNVDRQILKALEGDALTVDELAARIDRDRSHIVVRLGELRAARLVKHLDGVGFYRPDAVPEWFPV